MNATVARMMNGELKLKDKVAIALALMLGFVSWLSASVDKSWSEMLAIPQIISLLTMLGSVGAALYARIFGESLIEVQTIKTRAATVETDAGTVVQTTVQTTTETKPAAEPKPVSSPKPLEPSVELAPEPEPEPSTAPVQRFSWHGKLIAGYRGTSFVFEDGTLGPAQPQQIEELRRAGYRGIK